MSLLATSIVRHPHKNKIPARMGRDSSSNITYGRKLLYKRHTVVVDTPYEQQMELFKGNDLLDYQ